MKRTISIVLVLAMVLALSASLIGCSVKINTGTEAAKLLLANERLDSKALSKIDLGIGNSETVRLDYTKPVNDNGTSKYMRLSDQLGVHYTWTEFEQHSHSMVEFTQFMIGIEQTVEDVAADIERMKNKVGVTDKWVDGGFMQNEEHMLRVYENADMLIIKKYRHNALYVCTRYTNESAKNVYEVFSFYDYGNGDTARMRLIYVPGERYEWASRHSNGFNDYFIAENSRGYWVATRYDVTDFSSGFSPLIIKDGLGYGGFISLTRGEDNRRSDYDGSNVSSISIFDPISNRELFRISSSAVRGTIGLYFTAIKSGFVSVSTNDAEIDTEDNVYSTASLSKLVTVKGEYDAVDDIDEKGKFFFDSGYVQHYYGENFDYGNIEFSVNYEDGKGLSDYILSFGEYAKSLGLELYCDMNTVKNAFFLADEFTKGFGDAFEWNGYKMSSFQNAEKANQAFIDSTDTALERYEEVKDFPKAERRQRLSNNAKFAEIANLVMGESKYENGKITSSGVAVSIADTSLFESGLEYTLKLGLALCDSEGNPISVNTVALKSSKESLTKYEGGEIMLSLSGEYEIPKNLSQGEYALVVYASTADGIRVSEMEKLAFVEIQEGKLDSSAMDIEIKNAEGNLHATYTIKNVRYITMSATKESYTYNEVRRVIMQEILAYGYPDSEATLQTEDGTEINVGATLGKGTYRMTAYLNTSDGIAQSYVYLTIN